jgi:hypothetical protein
MDYEEKDRENLSKVGYELPSAIMTLDSRGIEVALKGSMCKSCQCNSCRGGCRSCRRFVPDDDVMNFREIDSEKMFYEISIN